MTAVVPLPIDKQVKDLTFNIERSIRYHSRRQAFFETFDTVVNTTNLILGSSAVAGLVTDRLEDWFVGVLSAGVAIVSFINIAMRSSAKSSLHAQLQQRYIDLLKLILRLDPTNETCGPGLKRCIEKRLDIERDEPPIYRVVDILAHNDQVRAQGGPDTHIWRVPAFKAATANFWHYETDSLMTVADFEHKSKQP